ncbi:MAG: hypothetical protein COU32_03235 [Candidatus Magasanikbacteria bacterium CG10_big_fil_rev_8_21_14_0_10_42_10]|uniref:Ribosomal RNA large subunit methyltransferase K/L-like methyltransferase domain-containing protein n=2 Tax=Candidatus Magasanikiibacteriota TaxID=1752731 RepID=A0A2H0TVT2_9BACT|nr:MAG: hypothetical protein COU32_03235 [Candidatus Magasanikbacteria bacterium CG10_big_fil_rev_8_21_14_0_10_42_10]PIZ93188.1 MAG: hypothetical protein COX82_03030 [Candidatus Magasanikbacteria bacterium CG_4_10_14_0_2_um_filter_41_10]
MHTYAFQLGHQRDLSQEEIFSVLSQKRILPTYTRLVGEYFLVSTDTPLDPEADMIILGGTRLIGEKLDPKGNAEETLFSYLSSLPSTTKLHFSVSGGTQASRLAIAVKKKLKTIGRSVRYVETKNTATILHNGLVERGTHLTIIDNVVYVTRAIQPIEDMSERDYGRPSVDGKSGMLPPKLSRMMINLAMPEKNDTLLDPFCGSGTLLGEALSLAIPHIIGSDISEKATSDSEKNVAWLQTNLESPVTDIQIFQSDVRVLTEHIEKESIDIIATEPYMGVPRTGREQRTFLEKQVQELQALYIDAFRVFAQILKPGGRVIFVVPQFRYKDDWVRVECQNNIKKLGFEMLPYQEKEMPLVYAREQQFVAREIWRWVKK